MGALWVCRALLKRLPLTPSRFPEAMPFKMVGLPSGLQVPVPFKTYRSCSHSSSHGDQSGPHSHSVACPCRGHLAFCLASTVHGFSASTLPFSTPNLSWGQPSMAGAFSHHAPPASSGSLAAQLGGFKHVGC